MKRLDASYFDDACRYLSPELTRAFASALRAVSRCPQSETAKPDEVSLLPEAAISDGATDRAVS